MHSKEKNYLFDKYSKIHQKTNKMSNFEKKTEVLNFLDFKNNSNFFVILFSQMILKIQKWCPNMTCCAFFATIFSGNFREKIPFFKRDFLLVHFRANFIGPKNFTGLKLKFEIIYIFSFFIFWLLVFQIFFVILVTFFLKFLLFF